MPPTLPSPPARSWFPQGDGRIPGFGTVTTVNPLAEGWEPPATPEGGRLVLYSGWLGEQAGPGLWTSSFRTWGPTGRDAFDRLTARLSEAESMFCFRPHARHVLADPQTCLSFLRAHESDGPDSRGSWGFGVLLDPVAMLTPDMLDQAEDHLRRAFGALADRADVPALLLTNAELVETTDSKELRACPLDAGVLNAEMIRTLAAEFWPADKPVFGLDT